MTVSSKPENPSVGIAIVGTGFGQKVHIPGFKAYPGTHVAAIYHRDQRKAQQLAEQYQIPHACSRIEEIVALPEVEGVSISTPPFLHFEMAKTVLQAGKHLLLEKPMALSVAEAQELYALAEAQGVTAILDFEFRCVPAWLRLQELLAADYVGKKRLIKIDWLVPGRADSARPWNWYARQDRGGGALGALGSHTFDYIHWLFGPIQRLCARLNTAIPTRPDPETGTPMPVDADDTCTVMIELRDGTLCQVCISAVTYQGRGHWVEVYGDRGTLVLGSDNQKDYVHGFKLWAAPAGQPLTLQEIPPRLAFAATYPDGRIAPFIRIVERWVEGIRQGRSPVPSLKEGVYSQLLMDLAHQSHQTGAWVEVSALSDVLAV